MVYLIIKILLYPILRILVRNNKGIENIPTDKNFIVVANHNKQIDPILVAYPIVRKLNRKVHFIASPRWWPYLGDYICGVWAGCIPLFSPKQAYRDAKMIINKGEIVGIFPEGYIKLKNRHPKTGAIRLAIETKKCILPVKVESSYFPFMSTVIFDKAIPPEYIRQRYKNPEKLMNRVYNIGLEENILKEVIREESKLDLSF